MSKAKVLVTLLALSIGVPMYSQPWNGGDVDVAAACKLLPTHGQLQSALALAQQQPNGGFGLNMWATVVNRDGIVCAVAFTGSNRGSQWPGSRVISAQKANTANAFSLDASSSSNGSGQATGLALSTANLYSAVQPGGSLFGLQASNPVTYSSPTMDPHGTMGRPVILWSAKRSEA